MLMLWPVGIYALMIMLFFLPYYKLAFSAYQKNKLAFSYWSISFLNGPTKFLMKRTGEMFLSCSYAYILGSEWIWWFSLQAVVVSKGTSRPEWRGGEREMEENHRERIRERGVLTFFLKRTPIQHYYICN